jgi:GNAT superfamily N-acetyltransferase
MTDEPGGSRARIRTAVTADLPELQAVYSAASLSNPGDAPLLLARPEFLHFTGEGIAQGRTRVATVPDERTERVVGFATVADSPDGDGLELEDLFVDPAHRRLGFARALVLDACSAARAGGHQRLWVTGNPHAAQFYHAVGFVDVAEATTELGNGSRMRLELSPR